ncbi:hypothetical protein OPT61_g5343 [Boeremia exigua]|uniref:Uncharacterized protein n=1 Tax=Boeremia exigua TaxID=749465 RepID=A0ACC2IAL6_9PLEO|nr:hypothetical protein OPT61_g5343 [Boeremia exigua]
MSFKAVFAASVLAASSLVNGAVISTRQQASTSQSCTNMAPGEGFVTKLASGVQFEVTCGRDYYGSDLADGLRWPGSFEGCLAACDAEPACKAISWTNGPCYLKGEPSELRGGDNVWTAKKNPAPTCDGSVNSDGASYITSAGNFEIMCGKDFGGNDLPSVQTESFAGCIEHCAADEKCVDVSYVYGSCYPKFAMGTPSDASWVWTAKFLGTRASAGVTPSPSVPGATPPVDTAPKALSCIGKENDGAKYGQFTVECGVDHFAADIGAVPTTTTFEECMDACEANTDCVVVSWVWGSCYMKNAKNEAPRTPLLPTFPSSPTPVLPSQTPPRRS